MTTVTLIAATLSMFSLIVVVAGITVLSMGRMLKSSAEKGLKAVSSPARHGLRTREARMPSLASLYIVS